MNSRQIFHLYFQLERPIANQMDKVLDTFDLTLSQWKFIDYLNNLGTSTLVEISSYFSIEKPCITRTINRLEEKEFVEQILGKDKREKRIQLTTMGKEVFATCQNTLDEIQLQFLNGISDQEQRIVLKMLTKIRTNLQKGVVPDESAQIVD